jgi:hypothetical protein
VETSCAIEGDALCFIAGACCTACGCGITLQGDCPAPGIWKGAGTDCAPNPCAPMTAVCCDETNGACTLEIQSTCTGAKTWRCQWQSCAPNPCPQFGACCSPATGACAFSLQESCAAPGLWHPEWASCSPNPCPQVGACCDLLERCTLALQSNCGAPGIWHPEWTVCTPGLCPPSAVSPPHMSGGTAFLGAVPNPFLTTTTVRFRLGYTGPGLCEVSTASGRLVRRIPTALRAGEPASVVWDGRNEVGRDLPTGVYWIRLVTPGGTVAGRAVLIR